MAQTKIDRNLNVVIPLEGGSIVYSIPVSKEVFEGNYLELAKVYSAIQEQGLITTGAAIAARMLRQLGSDNGDVQTSNKVKAFLSEVRRLCQVAVPNADKGYTIELLEDALKKELIEQEDVEEVENFITFSIAVSHLSSRAQAANLLIWVRGMRNVQVTSLSFMEWIDSFKTSTVPETSGEKLNLAT